MFFLDTDTLVFLLRGNTKVAAAFAAHDSSPKALSVISYGELLYGAYKSAKPIENASKVHRLRSLYPVFDVSTTVMETFSRLRADMDKDGKRVDDFDLLIASTTIHLGYTLVTNNRRHFRHVPGLSVENWAK